MAFIDPWKMEGRIFGGIEKIRLWTSLSFKMFMHPLRRCHIGNYRTEVQKYQDQNINFGLLNLLVRRIQEWKKSNKSLQKFGNL